MLKNTLKNIFFFFYFFFFPSVRNCFKRGEKKKLNYILNFPGCVSAQQSSEKVQLFFFNSNMHLRGMSRSDKKLRFNSTQPWVTLWLCLFKKEKKKNKVAKSIQTNNNFTFVEATWMALQNIETHPSTF